ncbi:MAG: addiction module RelE/StbE family toxin [Candidatus Azotimanducaceae bacterium]|jgi:addiction module RelE/StbE family toxin
MRITTTKKFDKQFKKQSDKIKKEFVRRIKIFQVDMNNPLLHVHKLSGAYNGLWSMNITGNVRVVFDTEQEPIVILIAIGTHSELYS